jgi:hypothetical protein
MTKVTELFTHNKKNNFFLPILLTGMNGVTCKIQSTIDRSECLFVPQDIMCNGIE